MDSKFDRASDRLNETVDDDAHFQQSLAELSRQLAARAPKPATDEPSLQAATSPMTEPPTPPASQPSLPDRAPSPGAQAAIREVVQRAAQSPAPVPSPTQPAPPAAAAEPLRLHVPKLGPAIDEPLRPAAARPRLAAPGLRRLAVLPRKASAVLNRRSGLGYVILWSLVIGTGAVAAGAFVGYLVKGPPHRSMPHTIADVVPPTPAIVSPTLQKIVETKVAPAAPPAATSASPMPVVATAPEGLPAVRPAAMEAPREAPATRTPEPQPNASTLAAGEIREVQGRLRAAGFNPGPIDGSAGPMTEAAVKQYQQARGLAPTGAADREVLARLRHEPPPRQQARAPAGSYAAAPPPQRRNDFFDNIDRMFRGR